MKVKDKWQYYLCFNNFPLDTEIKLGYGWFENQGDNDEEVKERSWKDERKNDEA